MIAALLIGLFILFAVVVSAVGMRWVERGQ